MTLRSAVEHCFCQQAGDSSHICQLLRRLHNSARVHKEDYMRLVARYAYDQCYHMQGEKHGWMLTWLLATNTNICMQIYCFRILAASIPGHGCDGWRFMSPCIQ